MNHPNKKISEEAVMCCTKVVDIQRRILKSGLLQSNESVQIFLTSLRNHLDESNRISSARYRVISTSACKFTLLSERVNELILFIEFPCLKFSVLGVKRNLRWVSVSQQVLHETQNILRGLRTCLGTEQLSTIACEALHCYTGVVISGEGAVQMNPESEEFEIVRPSIKNCPYTLNPLYFMGCIVLICENNQFLSHKCSIMISALLSLGAHAQ